MPSQLLMLGRDESRDGFLSSEITLLTPEDRKILNLTDARLGI